MYARLRCGGNLPLCLAFGVKNRLLRYGRDIRCQKQPSVVRDAFSEAYRAKSSTCRTGRIFSARNGPALFVRSGGPFHCSFDGTRDQKRPPLGGEQT